jgi:NACalpha-BTF3-like transcription factor
MSNTHDAVASFTEMGFTHQQAEDALKNTNGDVNEALTLLLSR